MESSPFTGEEDVNKRFDTNKDSAISLDEYLKVTAETSKLVTSNKEQFVAKSKMTFQAMDTNKNNIVSKEEASVYIK